MQLSDLKYAVSDFEYLLEDAEDDDPVIEVHYQPNYPLKAKIENIRMLNGKLVIALGAGTEYGSKEAWEAWDGVVDEE